jgi:hypothetical protein
VTTLDGGGERVAVDAEAWRRSRSRLGATPSSIPLLAGAAVLLVLCGALALGIIPLLSSFFASPKNYSEGWNAYHASRAAAGEILYSGDPRRLVNYPFLSFYLVGWLSPLVGDVLTTGRILSLIALAVITGGSFVVVRRLGGRPLDAVLASACVFGYQAIQAADWIGADDPQMMGEAWMIAGLICYLRDRTSVWRLAMTVALLAAGGFTKHNLIAIPVAISCDILWHDRRLFWIWCGLAAAALAALTGLTDLIAGGDFWHELLTPRVVSLHQMRYHPQKFAIAFKLPVLLSLVFLARPLPSSQAVLLRTYGLVSLVSAVMFSAGEGISFNIFLDPVIFLGIVAGLASAQWHGRLSQTRWVGRASLLLLPLVLAQPIVSRAPRTVAQLVDLPDILQSFRRHNDEFKTARDTIREQDGAALCDNLLLCFAAGKPLLVDPFNTRQMILTGRLDEASLVGDIARHRFAIIELPDRIHSDNGRETLAPAFRSPPRFTEPVLRAIGEYYAPFARGGETFYVPKAASSPGPQP